MTARMIAVLVAAALAAVSFDCRRNEPGPEPEPEQKPDLYIGDAESMSGNCYSQGVSTQFGETELRELHSQLNGPMVREQLQRYALGKELPSFSVTVMLQYDGPYSERLVRMKAMPPISGNGCGEGPDGLGFLFSRTLRILDKGPRIDYGYKHADGTPATPLPEVQTWFEPSVQDCSTAHEATR